MSNGNGNFGKQFHQWAQALSPALLALIGAWLMMWNNQTEIMGKLERIEEVINLKIHHIEEKQKELCSRMDGMDDFKIDYLMGGEVRRRVETPPLYPK